MWCEVLPHENIDDLFVSYDGSWPVKVADHADPVILEGSLDFAAGEARYSYDSDGRMTSDTGRGIDITYNPIDRPAVITTDTGTQYRYTYDATGRKLGSRRIADTPVTAGENEAMLYIGPFELKSTGGATALHRINLPWGYITGNGDRMTYVTDYQGNIRAVVDSLGNAVQTTDYYPCGLPMTTSAGPAANPYKYSGKELETRDGLNRYDFHARQYDPALGLFDRPDPMAITTPDITPYSYCNGNPINFVDPLGMDTLHVSYNGGKWIMNDPVLSEGDDVFIVTNGDKTHTFTFSEGEYGKRVCALNLEIGESKEDGTLGIYHVSGNKDAHGYFITPGGDASTAVRSNARIPEGEYPITTPNGMENIWRCIGVGGSVLNRGIRFHYGYGVGDNLMLWTTGCFILTTEYDKINEYYTIEKTASENAYKTFGNALGANSYYWYINSNGKKRLGTKVVNRIQSIITLKSMI